LLGVVESKFDYEEGVMSSGMHLPSALLHSQTDVRTLAGCL